MITGSSVRGELIVGVQMSIRSHTHYHTYLTYKLYLKLVPIRPTHNFALGARIAGRGDQAKSAHSRRRCILDYATCACESSYGLNSV